MAESIRIQQMREMTQRLVARSDEVLTEGMRDMPEGDGGEGEQPRGVSQVSRMNQRFARGVDDGDQTPHEEPAPSSHHTKGSG